MRRRGAMLARVVTATAIGLLSIVGVSGCSSESSPSGVENKAASIFATDQEALDATVAAYRKYLAVDEVISSDLESDTAAIREVTTVAYADEVISQYQDARDAGVTFRGATTVDSYVLVERRDSADVPRAEVLLCVDVSGVRVVSADGDVTPPGRDARLPILASFEAVNGIALLSGSELWSGEDEC